MIVKVLLIGYNGFDLMATAYIATVTVLCIIAPVDHHFNIDRKRTDHGRNTVVLSIMKAII